MKQKMYAWSDTAYVPIGDHTWVTTYIPGEGHPDVNKGDYWYCKGTPHTRARMLAFGIGGVDFASKIAAPHDPDDTVGIRYLSDGVCHQMSNRLLKFCFDNDGNPVTVKDAVGYELTTGMYGEYGGKGLTNKKRACRIKWESVVSEYKKTGDTNGL